MTFDAREFARVRNPVLLIAALAWILLVTAPGMAVFAHCPAPDPEAVTGVVSDAVENEPAGVACCGLGSDVGRDDVAGADSADPPYPRAHFRASAGALHRAFRSRL